MGSVSTQCQASWTGVDLKLVFMFMLMFILMVMGMFILMIIFMFMDILQS